MSEAPNKKPLLFILITILIGNNVAIELAVRETAWPGCCPSWAPEIPNFEREPAVFT